MVSMLFILIRPGTLWEEKGFIFKHKFNNTRKFNNHSNRSIFDCLTLQIDQTSVYMLSFHYYCLFFIFAHIHD